MPKITDAAAAASAPEIAANTELLNLADTLKNDAILPESKAEQAAQAAQEDAKTAAIETTAAIIKRGLVMAAGMACSKHEELKHVWTEKVIDDIARKAAVVLLKHGIEGGEFMKKYAEEFELIMAAGEPILLSHYIIKKKREEAIRATGGLPNGGNNGTIEPVASGSPNNPIVLA